MADKPYQDPDVLRRLYIEEDLPQKEIADRFEVSDSAISNWVRRHGIEKDQTDPRKDAELLQELYWERGMSIQEVAEELGTYRDVVHRWLADLGIERRPGPQTERPWHDADRLERLYHDEGMSQREIAERLGTQRTTIGKWMRRFGIETEVWYEAGQKATRVEWAFFYTDSNGYEKWGTRVGMETVGLPVHRLVAVAEHGFDEVAGKVVHHKNGIKWDNRPENLEVMTDSEHKQLHARERGVHPHHA